jgi:hypothetical protein
MKSKAWINLEGVQAELSRYFQDNKRDINEFGSTVNQTFEAFVFASLVNWYSSNGWNVKFIQPDSADSNYVRLKYSTRGKPGSYTYALCTKGENKVQVRHNLRVATKHHKRNLPYPANVVLDVVVINDVDLSRFKSDDFVDNRDLITFGEAKHMSAFAELIASFVGLVHEIKPEVLKRIRRSKMIVPTKAHPAPFLYVSGHLNRTGRGLVETLRSRGYDVDVWDREATIFGIPLSTERIKDTFAVSESNPTLEKTKEGVYSPR